MKSFRGTIKSSKKDRKSNDEKQELINSQANNPSYVQGTNTSGDPTLKRSATLPTRNPMWQSPQTMPRKISESLANKDHCRDSFEYPPPSLSFNTGSPPSSPNKATKSVAELTTIEFQKLPFNFYTRQVWSWRDAISLTMLILSICIFVPSIIVLIASIIIKGKTDVRVKVAERRQKTLYCSIALIASVIRDIFILIIIVCFSCNIPLAPPVLAYPVFAFVWCLILVAPLLIFFVADVKYVFNFNTTKEKCMQILQHFNFANAREAEFTKIESQETYFTEHYKKISTISRWSDEVTYLQEVISRENVIKSFALAIFFCFLRFVIVLTIGVISSPVYPLSLNGTVLNGTDERPIKLYVPFLIASCITSLCLSILLSAFMVYVILWGVAMLGEWRDFNSNERDDKLTLISRGPQSMAMWWKVRETLNLYSNSSMCWSVLMGRILFVSSTSLVVLISISVMMMTRRSTIDIRISSALSLIVDNIFLYVFVILQWSFSISIEKERTLATHALQLKKLNLGYEIASAVNLDHQFADRETNVRSRVRLLRGRLALLQDLITATEYGQNDRCSFTNIATFLLGCLVLVSTIYSLR